jgi:hypothetical protein
MVVGELVLIMSSIGLNVGEWVVWVFVVMEEWEMAISSGLM